MSRKRGCGRKRQAKPTPEGSRALLPGDALGRTLRWAEPYFRSSSDKWGCLVSQPRADRWQRAGTEKVSYSETLGGTRPASEVELGNPQIQVG